MLEAPFNGAIFVWYCCAIDLMLVVDSNKDVELFLLMQKIVYDRTERRLCFGDTCHKLPGFTLEDEFALVEITVLTPAQWRASPRSAADGNARAKLKLECLLLREETGNLINVRDDLPVRG